MKYIKYLFLIVLMAATNSCSELDDQLENPNNINPDKLDANLLLNKVMVGFSDFVGEVNERPLELSRQTVEIGGEVYANAYQAEDLDDTWEYAYQNTLVQIETLLKAVDGKGLSAHTGISKVLKAYTYLTLVDVFGDVPFTEANRGTEGAAFFNPKADKGADIYAGCIAILDDAIADLALVPVGNVTRDIYYAGSRANWTALANTLKLKAYMNLSLSTDVKTKITDLLASNLIDTEGENFTYKYGTASIPAKSRHPLYSQMYAPTAGEANGYVSNYFLWNLYGRKSVPDPRWRYYVYRQVGSIEKALDDEPESVPCVLSPRPDHYNANSGWCSFDPGFFGRDHGNFDGIPPDGKAITVVGIYPCGGRADLNENPKYQESTQSGQGANGGGIIPIWMSCFTDFVKAEAATRLGTDGDPKTLLLSGIQKSINSVKAFADAKGQSVPASLVTPTQDYLDEVEGLYDAAANKMDVIGKEYWLALWGNGIEGYNLYRRTGKPADMQPMRAPNPGVFLYSFPYSANFANLNNTITQKDLTKVNKVFWDTNPDDFVK